MTNYVNLKYPVYIISKGRWALRHTVRAFEKYNTPYRIVIEPQEFKEYASVIDYKNILTLPFSNLGQGGIPARNWVWEHSILEGHQRHWILDDNIAGFDYCNFNDKKDVSPIQALGRLEEIVDKFENVPMAGLNYSMFVLKKAKRPPIQINSRVYSCINLSNAVPHRWRGRYNEDTDLSLRFLKDGFCTLLLNEYTCRKLATMQCKGGNTDELYKQDEKFDGRLEMAKSLQRQHPDCVTIKHKWGRYQHSVDYSQWRNRKPRLKQELKNGME